MYYYRSMGTIGMGLQMGSFGGKGCPIGLRFKVPGT